MRFTVLVVLDKTREKYANHPYIPTIAKIFKYTGMILKVCLAEVEA